MIKFNKANIYKIHLSLIRSGFLEDTLERILTPLGEAIKNCESLMDGAEKSNNQDYIDSVVDFEVEIIENLLGTAFVACQTNITNIVSRIMSLHKYHNKLNPKRKLLTTGNNKIEIISFGNKPNNSKYTEVQLIDAFANYFKHKDEWRANWQKVNVKSAKTVKIIESVGARSGSTGNFRTASKVLGNTEYLNTEIFYGIINNWCKKLYDGYYSELKNLNLI